METLDKITEDLKSILSEESLKLLVGSEVLTKLLKDSENMKERLISKQHTIDIKSNQIEALDKRVTNLELENENLSEELEAFKIREHIIEENKFNHRVRNVENEFEKRRGDEMKELLTSALRNEVIKKTLFDEKAFLKDAVEEEKDQYGNTLTYPQPQQIETKTVESTTTETKE